MEALARLYDSPTSAAAGEPDAGPLTNFPLYIDGVDDATPSLAPFVTTSLTAVGEILDACALTPRDCLLELGSGDGRVVLGACLLAGVEWAVGIEWEAWLVAEACARRTAAGLGPHSCAFLHGDLFAHLSWDARSEAWSCPDFDAARVTVLVLYLLPTAEARLAPLLSWFYQRGTKIVSIVFPLDLGFNEICHKSGSFYIYTKGGEGRIRP